MGRYDKKPDELDARIEKYTKEAGGIFKRWVRRRWAKNIKYYAGDPKSQKKNYSLGSILYGTVAASTYLGGFLGLFTLPVALWGTVRMYKGVRDSGAAISQYRAKRREKKERKQLEERAEQRRKKLQESYKAQSEGKEDAKEYTDASSKGLFARLGEYISGKNSRKDHSKKEKESVGVDEAVESLQSSDADNLERLVQETKDEPSFEDIRRRQRRDPTKEK